MRRSLPDCIWRTQTFSGNGSVRKPALSYLHAAVMQEVNQEAYALFCSNLCTLTPKEREVFDLYLQGRKGKEIQEILNISQNTLKYHNKNIYDKLGVSSRKELLKYATLMQKDAKEDGL